MACPRLVFDTPSSQSSPEQAFWGPGGDSVLLVENGFVLTYRYPGFADISPAVGGVGLGNQWLDIDEEGTVWAFQQGVFRKLPYLADAAVDIAAWDTVDGEFIGYPARPVAYNPADGYIYMHAWGTTGQRILRIDRTTGAASTFYRFSTFYENYVGESDAVDFGLVDGVLYGTVYREGASGERYKYALDLATGVATIDATPTTTTLRLDGTDADGYAYYRTTAGLQKVFPDLSTEPAGCDLLDAFTSTRGHGRPGQPTIWVAGDPLSRDVYTLPPGALDVPTLRLDGLAIPHRQVAWSMESR